MMYSLGSGASFNDIGEQLRKEWLAAGHGPSPKAAAAPAKGRSGAKRKGESRPVFLRCFCFNPLTGASALHRREAPGLLTHVFCFRMARKEEWF